MIRLSLILGSGFHKVNRTFSILTSMYLGWTLQAHVTIHARRCGSIRFAGPARIANVDQLEVGDNVHVNAGANWVCEGGLVIGDNTIFSSDVTIYTRNHNYEGTELPFDATNILRPVTIGRNVWIGTRVTILPGAKIGDGVIIGAGAVVAGTVPKGTIFGAQRAAQIGERDMEHYRRVDLACAVHRPVYPLKALLSKLRGRK